MKKISIILPVYNVVDYLDHSIQSILNQSYPHFELLIINDGSTDGSGELAEKYATKDSRITPIHQVNQGLSMARNKGLDQATGDYVFFVDSDDFIHPDTLHILYQNIEQYEADVAVGNHQEVAANEYPSDVRQNHPPKILNNFQAVAEIVKKSETNMIIAVGKLYKRSLFHTIRYPAGKYHEDEFVTYQLLYQAEKVVVTDTKLYYYTQRRDSITGTRYSLTRLDKLEALKEAIDFFVDHQEKELAHHARARYLLNLQIAYYRVKVELADEPQVLKQLKEEYDAEYRRLKNTNEKLSITQRLMFQFFKQAPNVYVKIIETILSIKSVIENLLK